LQTKEEPEKESISRQTMSESPKKVAKTANKPEEYFLAIDIESCGKGDILAIGATFGKKDGTVIESRAFCSKPPSTPAGYDKHTWEEFWINHPQILARIDAEAIEDHIGVFHDWLLGLEKIYGPFGRRHREEVHLRLITDNAAYDLGEIDTHFKPRFGHGIKHMFDDYVPDDNPTEQERFLLPKERELVESMITAVHDHYPAHDSLQDFQRQCALELVAANREKERIENTETDRVDNV
jgi:hypothetical protein